MHEPILNDPAILSRFLDRVDQTESCWLWTGSLARGGYGRFSPTRKFMNKMAHRVSYEYYVGPIPEGLQIDHLCRVRNCVNPDHLEPVTARENTIRGVSFAAQNAAREECVNGHPFNEENTYYKTTSRGTAERHCRECGRQANRDWYRKWKAAGGVRVRGKRLTGVDGKPH